MTQEEEDTATFKPKTTTEQTSSMVNNNRYRSRVERVLDDVSW